MATVFNGFDTKFYSLERANGAMQSRTLPIDSGVTRVHGITRFIEKKSASKTDVRSIY